MKLTDYLLEQYGILDESGAGLSRVLSKLDSGVDFLFITAFRGSNSIKQNIKNNNELIKYARKELQIELGAYKIVGHWKECSIPLESGQTLKDCTGKIINALEETWLFTKPDNVSSEDFDKLAQKVARKYDQDAYVIRLKGKLTLKGKDGTDWADLGKASSKSLSSGFSKIADQQGYSELDKLRKRGRSANIVFEDVHLQLVVPKDQNMSKILFDKANILY